MAIKMHGSQSVLSIKARERAREIYWGYYDRETHRCNLCGDTETVLEVHHIDGDYLNNNILNLLALCYQCHSNIHKRKETRQNLREWKDNPIIQA